jgi:hypothetical protein
MHNARYSVCFATLLTVVSATAIAAAQNLIQNGDFATPVVSNYEEFDSPSSGITGWTVSFGNVDLSASFNYPAYLANQSVDLAGDMLGGIEQQFNTTPGQQYQLDFYYSNNGNYVGNVTADVSVTGNSTLLEQSVSHSDGTLSNMDYDLFSEDFTADSTNATLAFAATGESLDGPQPGAGGIVVDDVSVTSVPEPGSLWLLGMSLVAIAARHRRLPYRP